MLAGQCRCGAVHYRVEDAFEYAAYCHCSRCRRRSGAAFTAFGGIPFAKLEILGGDDSLAFTEVSNEGYNAFCKSCFSPLFSTVREHAYAHVQYGTLTDAPSRRPDRHFFVGSKAPWHQITDDLPKYDELPED
jgi:hypothetical protein